MIISIIIMTNQINYFVKVGDNLVQKSETFHALVVPLKFHIKFAEVRNRSEHHRDVIQLFVV